MKVQKVAVLFTLFSMGTINSVLSATWSGGGTDNKWMTGGNWGGTAPVANEALIFDGTTQLNTSNNFSANTSFGTITFNSGAGSFSLNGNSIRFGNITDNSTATQTINLFMTMTTTRTVTVTDSGKLQIAGNISGTGFGLTKNGAGTLVLSGANGYTGTTNINAGTLLVNGSPTGGGGYAVGSNGTLGGSGTINPTGTNLISFASGGVLASGIGDSAAPGLTLKSTGNTLTSGLLNLSGAVLDFSLDVGSSASYVTLNGTIANEITGLSGNTFNFSDLSSGSLTTGLYTLFLSDSSTSNPFQGLGTGTLSGFTLNGLSTYSAQLELNQLSGSGSVYALQLDITSVPEPTAAALLFGGLGLLLFIQRRRSAVLS